MGAVGANYDISYVAGTVTVNAAAATTTTTSGTTTSGTSTSGKGTAGTGTAGTGTPGTTTTTGTAKPPRPTAANKPTLTSLSPAARPMAGGTAMVIRGKWFDDVERARFGTRTARFKVVSAEAVIARLPAGGGTVAVSVKTAAGISACSKPDSFTYREKK